MTQHLSIAIVTDAWHPQVNGVVRTLNRTRDELEALGHRVDVLSPEGYRSIPCPTYPEIRLALGAGRSIQKRLTKLKPDAVHIATEGPLGLAARRWCKRHALPFTTSYHTRFPEYIRLRLPIPLSWSYAFLKWFHGPAHRMLVATPSMERELVARGFQNIGRWSRGVDLALFQPQVERTSSHPPKLLYVGRVAPEKNIEAFLTCPVVGQKVVVGGGPALETLREAYPEVTFLGYRHGAELAAVMADADCFVFPSLTDTFGLVILESMACGVPVAAFPAPGPIDLITNGENGWISDDLAEAITHALQVPRQACRAFAEGYSWPKCTAQFISQLKPADPYELDETLS